MKETNNNGYVTSFDDEIDLKELFFCFVERKNNHCFPDSFAFCYRIDL